MGQTSLEWGIHVIRAWPAGVVSPGTEPIRRQICNLPRSHTVLCWHCWGRAAREHCLCKVLATRAGEEAGEPDRALNCHADDRCVSCKWQSAPRLQVGGVTCMLTALLRSNVGQMAGPRVQ